ncbi:MBL fold metallo-hydrolase [Engelhardtia mirabilis]|uniref:Ribonuclease Z n=1 Tax=Engelhardtia mirabilis TaxID=2528011 RepID=A0A518BR37_9BACT|nr:ribonuclease Z [Planctomycetes bacterium Pla133]QDV03764.1 ribonuclease Z [Planctomycetes bacterium Pla86]
MHRLAGVAVGGISLGGIETSIDLPEHKLCFDIGRCPRWAVSRPRVLITHAHMDHLGGLAYHCATRALMGMGPPEYLVPRQNEAAIGELFATWRRLDRSELEHRLVPLGPGDEHRLGRDLVAVPFRTPHVVPSQGYGLWRERRQLREEYQGLPQEELRRLAVDEGLELSTLVSFPEVAFTGDTRAEVIEQQEVVRKARLLVMECTFLDDRIDVDQARETGHVHLDDLLERVHLLENEALLLTHFSARYSPREVQAILDARLPAEVRARTTALLERVG